MSSGFESVERAIKRLAKPNMIAFDIGANQGLAAQAFSPRVRQVIAFDPVPWCIETLTALNLPNITLVPVAVSDVARKSTFFVDARPGTGAVGSSLCNLEAFQGEREEIEVDVITIDDYVKETGLIPDFIKIDVEGSEEKVIEGAMATILKHHPIIVFEVWGLNWPRFKDVIAKLSGNYRFECASDGTEALSRYSAGDVTTTDDVICIPHQYNS